MRTYREISITNLVTMKANFAKMVGYFPSAGQASVHRSMKRFRVVLAGARFGKSMLAGFEIAFYLLFPDFRVWCVAPVYELAEKEFNWALDFLSRFKHPRIGTPIINLAKVSNSSRGSREIRFPWGSFCKTKSTEKPQALLGEELDLLIMGEAACMPREPWERMLRARIGPRSGMMLAPSTGAGDNNLFAEFVERGKSESPDDQDWQTWQFCTIDNPTFEKSEYERAKKDLDPDVFREQYEGKLVSRRGFVFRFDNLHIINTLPHDIKDWPVIIGIQPGFKNPFVAVIIAIHRVTHEYIVIDEVHVTERLLPDVVPILSEKCKGLVVLCILTDYWQRGPYEEMKKIFDKITVNDIEKRVGHNASIVARVRSLQNVMKLKPEGPPRLRIYAKCEKTIDEFQKCKWPDKPDEEADKLESEIPLPKYFQAPQAVSHVVAFCEISVGYDVYNIQRS